MIFFQKLTRRTCNSSIIMPICFIIFLSQLRNSGMLYTVMLTNVVQDLFSFHPVFPSFAFCRLLNNCACVDIQVKERCQKGIPPSLRGRAWLYLTGGKVKREQNQGKFEVSRIYFGSLPTACLCYQLQKCLMLGQNIVIVLRSIL